MQGRAGPYLGLKQAPLLLTQQQLLSLAVPVLDLMPGPQVALPRGGGGVGGGGKGLGGGRGHDQQLLAVAVAVLHHGVACRQRCYSV